MLRGFRLFIYKFLNGTYSPNGDGYKRSPANMEYSEFNALDWVT